MPGVSYEFMFVGSLESSFVDVLEEVGAAVFQLEGGSDSLLSLLFRWFCYVYIYIELDHVL